MLSALLFYPVFCLLFSLLSESSVLTSVLLLKTLLLLFYLLSSLLSEWSVLTLVLLLKILLLLFYSSFLLNFILKDLKFFLIFRLTLLSELLFLSSLSSIADIELVIKSVLVLLTSASSSLVIPLVTVYKDRVVQYSDFVIICLI